jgi:hypothetical protein
VYAVPHFLFSLALSVSFSSSCLCARTVFFFTKCDHSYFFLFLLTFLFLYLSVSSFLVPFPIFPLLYFPLFCTPFSFLCIILLYNNL